MTRLTPPSSASFPQPPFCGPLPSLPNLLPLLSAPEDNLKAILLQWLLAPALSNALWMRFMRHSRSHSSTQLFTVWPEYWHICNLLKEPKTCTCIAWFLCVTILLIFYGSWFEIVIWFHISLHQPDTKIWLNFKLLVTQLLWHCCHGNLKTIWKMKNVYV